MMPSCSKGTYVFHPGGKCHDLPLSTSSTQPPNTVVMDEARQTPVTPSEVSSNIPVPGSSCIPHASTFQLSTIDASAPPSAPFSFLSPLENDSGSSSVLTSISWGKCKAGAISGGESVAGTTVSEASRKRNCGQPSATVTTQRENTEAMKHMSYSVDGLSQSMANQTITTNNDIFRQAAMGLKAHISDYLVDNYLVLGMYLTAIENKQVAIFFMMLEGEHWKSFLDRCLGTINAWKDQ